jgi:hypothetical protein
LKPPPAREPSDGRFEHDGVPDPRSHEDQLRRPHCVSTGPTPSQQPLIAPAANPKCVPPRRHSDESIGVRWLLRQTRPTCIAYCGLQFYLGLGSRRSSSRLHAWSSSQSKSGGGYVALGSARSYFSSAFSSGLRPRSPCSCSSRLTRFSKSTCSINLACLAIKLLIPAASRTVNQPLAQAAMTAFDASITSAALSMGGSANET